MKLCELFEQQIQEAGITTASLDKAARLALRAELPKMIATIIQDAERHVPPKQELDYGGYDTGRHYDNIYNYLIKDSASRMIMPICHAVSAILQRVVVARIKEISDLLQHPDKSHILKNIQVVVEAREMSTDIYKVYGGYFSSFDGKIKVFIDSGSLENAAFDLVQNEILGESEGHGYQHMISIIVPVFVHEYAHLEQYLRQKKDVKDFGYITTGIKRRGGKRGGYIRSPRESLSSYLRYKGNLDEIDSFASQAASELMHEILNNLGGWRTVDVNSRIDNIQQDLTYGYGASSTYNHYAELLRNAFDNAYAESRLNPEQMAKVWKRFAKRVYQKLQDYRDRKKGKYITPSKYDDRWVDAADRMPMKDAIKTIAKLTAEKIKTDPDIWYPPEEVYKKILDGNYVFLPEQFIHNYYFDWDTPDEKMEKIMNAFRSMTAKYYSRLT